MQWKILQFKMTNDIILFDCLFAFKGQFHLPKRSNFYFKGQRRKYIGGDVKYKGIHHCYNNNGRGLNWRHGNCMMIFLFIKKTTQYTSSYTQYLRLSKNVFVYYVKKCNSNFIIVYMCSP